MGLWIGDRLSPVELLCINSYLQNGHEFELYLYDNIVNIPQGVNVTEANLVIPRDYMWKITANNSLGCFSDLFRYKLLLDKGGWWSDLDAVCVRRFDFPSEYVFMKEKGKEEENICNGIIKCPIEAEIMKFCYDRAFKLIGDGLPLQWGDTGPKLLREAVYRYSLERYSFPSKYFSPIGYWEVNLVFGDQKIDAGTYSIHLYNEIWNLRNYPKYGIYNPNSLFEKLKKRYGIRNSLFSLIIDFLTDFKRHGFIEGMKIIRRKMKSMLTSYHNINFKMDKFA